MNTRTSDNKENVTNCDNKNLNRHTLKLLNSENVSSRILQKLNKVLTEEGLNLNVAEFLQAAVIEKKSPKYDCAPEGGERMDFTEAASTTSAEVQAVTVEIMNKIFDTIFDEHTKPNEEHESVNETNILLIDATVEDQGNIEVKNDISSASEKCKDVESLENGKDSIDMINKEEREDFIIMEEIELDVTSQLFEELPKESRAKDTKSKQIKVANTNKVSKGSSKSVFRSSAKSNMLIKNVWVTNIERTTKAADLKKLFSKYGKVTGAKIVTDGTCCYGYITMASKEDAEKCIKKLHNYEMNGKKIGVCRSKPIKLEKSCRNLGSNVKRIEETGEAKKNNTSPGAKEDNCASKRREYEESLREKRITERLVARKRKLDEEARALSDQRNRQRKIEVKIRELQRQLDDGKEKLRFDREQFEKEKSEIMASERERQRRDRDQFEKEKYEFERMKREFKRLKNANVEKKPPTENFKSMRFNRDAKVETRHSTPLLSKNDERKKPNFDYCSDGKTSSYHGSSYHGDKSNDYSKIPRKSYEYDRSKSSFDRTSYNKLSKSMECGHCHSSSKEDKSCSFGGASRSAKRAASPSFSPSCESPWKQPSTGGVGSGTPKNYQQLPKSNWGMEHSWRSPPVAPTPPKIGWNSGNGGRMSGVPAGCYSASFSTRAAPASSGIVCPSPPGVNYTSKYETQGYSHCTRKY